MKDEVSAAVEFLTRLVGCKNDLPEDKVTAFRERLTTVLLNKFRSHWFPDRPSRGQAFRCIRVNEYIRRDSTLESVCHDIGIRYNDLCLPIELTLWIDPEEVTCRFGEHQGSYCVIASFKDGNKENYVAQINVEELEKKSVEQARQLSFDHVNMRKKRQQSKALSNQLSAGYLGAMSHYMNGGGPYMTDYNMTTFYGSPGYNWTPNGKYGPTTYNSSTPLSPPSPANMAPFTTNGFSAGSPPRGSPFTRGTTNGGAFTNGGGMSNGHGGSSPPHSTTNGKFSRGLNSAFNSTMAAASSSYQGPSNPTSSSSAAGDRYHFYNKSIVKA